MLLAGDGFYAELYYSQFDVVPEEDEGELMADGMMVSAD